MTKFGEVLRSIREARGLNQNQLAYKAGLSGATINMIEKGQRANPQASTIGRLSDALGVSADYLLYESEFRERMPALAGLIPPEVKLIEALRSVPTASTRVHLVELFSGLCAVTRGIDMGRADTRQIRLVAEETMKYGADGEVE